MPSVLPSSFRRRTVRVMNLFVSFWWPAGHFSVGMVLEVGDGFKNPTNIFHMSLPEPIFLSNGAAFWRAEERIREYCEVDVYRDIDYRGGYDDRHSVSDSLTADDMEAADNLYARLGALDRMRLLHDEGIPPLLAAVRDVELGGVKDEGWEEVKAGLGALLAELLSIRYVKLAKATKILHLKRPHLVPVLDSPVVRFLTGTDMEANEFSSEELLHLGLLSLDIARTDIAKNGDAFDGLQKRLSDLPTPLTTVRMYDILCRTDQKWVRDGDPSGKYGTATRSLDQSPPRSEAVASQAQATPTSSGPKSIPGEIRTTKEFRQIVGRAEGFIVITGTTPPRVHGVLCPLLTDDRFNENVIINEGRGGRYYWRSNFNEARREFGAVACKRCDPGGLAPRRDW